MSVNNLGERELHLKSEIDISIPGARQLQNIRHEMINNTMGGDGYKICTMVSSELCSPPLFDHNSALSNLQICPILSKSLDLFYGSPFM